MSKRETYNTEDQNTLFEDELFAPAPAPSKEKEKAKVTKTEKKSFNDTDKIPCVSITVGKLLMIGQKSGNVYRWTNMGEIEEVEYRDLMAEVRATSSFVFEPRFIVQDDDFLAQNDTLLVKYGQLYTPADIEKVLTFPAEQLKATIKSMPLGAQNAVKDLANRKITSGELDSVQRVKALDEFFGTNMLIKLTQ